MLCMIKNINTVISLECNFLEDFALYVDFWETSLWLKNIKNIEVSIRYLIKNYIKKGDLDD